MHRTGDASARLGLYGGSESRPFSPTARAEFGGLNSRVGSRLAARRRLATVRCMKFRLVVECYAETARWSAVFPELPGCGSAGDTEEEAIAHAREALALWFEPTPVELHRGAKLLEVMLP